MSLAEALSALEGGHYYALTLADARLETVNRGPFLGNLIIWGLRYSSTILDLCTRWRTDSHPCRFTPGIRFPVPIG
jgi:hypothetical protein